MEALLARTVMIVVPPAHVPRARAATPVLAAQVHLVTVSPQVVLVMVAVIAVVTTVQARAVAAGGAAAPVLMAAVAGDLLIPTRCCVTVWFIHKDITT